MASTSHLPNILPRVVVTIVDDFLSKKLYTHSGYEDINLKSVSYARHFLEKTNYYCSTSEIIELHTQIGSNLY